MSVEKLKHKLALNLNRIAVCNDVVNPVGVLNPDRVEKIIAIL
jgi:hypothetical protein